MVVTVLVTVKVWLSVMSGWLWQDATTVWSPTGAVAGMLTCSLNLPDEPWPCTSLPKAMSTVSVSSPQANPVPVACSCEPGGPLSGLIVREGFSTTVNGLEANTFPLHVPLTLC